jgi:phosphoglycolate phosphatase
VIPPFPVYLFDIDGTLVDSAADICGAIEEVLGKPGRTPARNGLDHTYLKSFIGRHLIDLFADVYPHYTLADIDGLIAEYRTIYSGRGHNCTSVFPGVAEALARLGGRKSTATTKGTPTTRIVLEKFGLLPYFDHVQGTDGFPAKPAPDVILKSIEVLGVKPEDCLMVGDAAPDMEAGRAAGVRLCAVRYGYGNQAEMSQWEPDFWIDDLRELVPEYAPGLTDAGRQTAPSTAPRQRPPDR